MSKGIKTLRDAFAEIYETLDGKYEGYIQMSDKRIEYIFNMAQVLPSLESLYKDASGKETDVNYVLEMALFKGNKAKGKSILVRQHNDSWLVLEKELVGTEDIEVYYTIKSNAPKMKMAQIWEPVANEFCEGLDVLEPKFLMFAGFEKGDES